MGLRVQEFEFRIEGSGSKVQGLGEVSLLRQSNRSLAKFFFGIPCRVPQATDA